MEPTAETILADLPLNRAPRIGLIDFDGVQVNLALMKLSAWFKSKGATVLLNNFLPSQVDMVFVSVLFERNKLKAAKLGRLYHSCPIFFGGTGWDTAAVLPTEIENSLPDYNLYTVNDIYPRLRGIATRESKMKKAQTIVDAGISFLYRGCVRQCSFCTVPKKEPGGLKRVSSLADIINPRSNVVTLLDNNILGAPDFLDIVAEIRERKLIVDFCQGLDLRLMTEEYAHALSTIKHLRSIHYAWDQMPAENKLKAGISTLSKFVNVGRQMCFMLVGYDTTWEEDFYRYEELTSIGVDPLVMFYNRPDMPRKRAEKLALPFETLRLHHFKRWVNSRIYASCSDFEQYKNWAKDRDDWMSQGRLIIA